MLISESGTLEKITDGIDVDFGNVSDLMFKRECIIYSNLLMFAFEDKDVEFRFWC
jgi:hypothetical protein